MGLPALHSLRRLFVHYLTVGIVSVKQKGKPGAAEAAPATPAGKAGKASLKRPAPGAVAVGPSEPARLLLDRYVSLLLQGLHAPVVALRVRKRLPSPPPVWFAVDF